MNILNNKFLSYKRIYSFSIPIIFSMLSHTFASIIDTIMVSQLGKVSLASVGLSSLVVNSLIGFLGSISPAINILISRNLEKKSLSKISYYIWSGFYLSLIIGIPITVIGIIFSTSIFIFMGAEPIIINSGIGYMQVRFLATTLVLSNFVFSSFFKSIEKTNIIMKVTILSNILNILGNYLLIFGNLGFPALGIKGAGLSTLISYIAGILIYIIYILRKDYSIYFKWHRSFIEYKKYILSIIKISIPISIEELFAYVLVPTVIMMIVTRMGTNALAANEIVLNIISFIAIPHYAFSQSATTFVSKSNNARENKDFIKLIKDVVACDYVYLIIVSIILLMFRENIVTLFIEDPNVSTLATSCLIILIITQPFDGLWKILSSSLRALGYLKWVTIISLIFNWAVYVPLSFYLGMVLNLGLLGIFIGQLILKIIISMICFLKINRDA